MNLYKISETVISYHVIPSALIRKMLTSAFVNIYAPMKFFRVIYVNDFSIIAHCP